MGRRIFLLPLLIALALAAGGAALTGGAMPSHAVAESAEGYYCPMHPDVTSDHAGNCPICGMTLVKTASGQVVPHDEQFHVSEALQQRIGVVTEPVARRPFSAGLSVPGQVVADERRAVSLSPKVDGWIKRLGVSVVGQPVRKGQVLFEIYSPDLQQRQRDYLDLLTRRDALTERNGMNAVGNSAPDLMLASVARERWRARQRLAAADVPESVLLEIEQSRRVRDTVPVLAEHDGVVTAIGAREGAYVMPAQTVVSYADLNAVWVELLLSPEQLGRLQPRETVQLRATVDAQARASARIDARLAVVDPVTRQARLRVPLPTGSRGFLPGTLVQARIEPAPRELIAISKDAVLRSGRGDSVIVADGGGHFRQIPIELGAENDDWVEVRGGLETGQVLVVNGQFLLGAEASLQASRRRLAPVAAMSAEQPMPAMTPMERAGHAH